MVTPRALNGPPRSRAGTRRVVVPVEAARDESGLAYLIRSGTIRDRPALTQLRSTAEAIGSANAYFGRPSRAPSDGPSTGSPPAGSPPAGSRPTTKAWPAGGTTIVAESGAALLGAARFFRLAASTDATVAIAVGEVPSPSEIGRHLVQVLAGAAHEAGVEHFVADLAATNVAMLAMFVSAGFATEIGVGDGVMHMVFSVDPEERNTGRANVRAIPLWESPASRDRPTVASSVKGA